MLNSEPAFQSSSPQRTKNYGRDYVGLGLPDTRRDLQSDYAAIEVVKDASPTNPFYMAG